MLTAQSKVQAALTALACARRQARSVKANMVKLAAGGCLSPLPGRNLPRIVSSAIRHAAASIMKSRNHACSEAAKF